jgi:hypothetical protein
MALLLFFGTLSMCAGAAAWAYKSKSPAPTPMKKTVRADDAWFDEDTVPTQNVNCQDMSNSQLTWTDPDHRGLAKIEDWAGFKLQKCTTKPAQYTSNTALFGYYYSTKLSGGQIPPNHDPALTDKQAIDSSGEDVVENVVAGKKLEIASNGVLSLKTASGAIWSTPAGSASGTYTLKFDANTYNAGNLCVFDKDGNTPWCMLPRVAVSRTASSTDGSSVNLSATQQSQLASGNMKNSSDTAQRFAMIDDSGQFCMYRGSPGSIQGSSIACK